MLVPEATVDQDSSSVPRQDDVRAARQVLAVKPITQAGRVQGSADAQLR